MCKYTLLPYDFMQINTLFASQTVFFRFYFCYLLFKNSFQGILDNCTLFHSTSKPSCGHKGCNSARLATEYVISIIGEIMVSTCFAVPISRCLPRYESEFRWKETGLSFQVQFVKLDYAAQQEIRTSTPAFTPRDAFKSKSEFIE
ncbi:MAG TPA: hypothetical protein DEF88_12355 [Porphyromonadaceae bacterium]|nr:hypothetical protein [Porphyromonadaceae bacterium]HBX21229.1 hypothetical protein [Porphyromonadaceae bacterium]HCM20607.1 hypothetical protein [Porphyromonadaceae bacterium]